MQFSENTNNLFAALAKFQKDCPQITKDATVNVSKSGKFQYKFEYATYGNILKTTKPELSKNELAVVQNVSEKGVQTIIVHSSGQWMKSDYLPILLTTVEDGETVNAKEQDTGSSITYKKRYQLAAMLLQDADTDDDANTADGNEPQFEQPKQKTVTKPKSNGKASKPKTEKKEEPEHEPSENNGSGDVDAILAGITDKTELIKWWKAKMDNDDSDGTFRKENQAKVFKRLEQLK